MEPFSSRPTCCFFFCLLRLLYPAPILFFNLNCHLQLLGHETYILRACLFLCPSSDRVLSHVIALDIRLFLVILRLLSFKLLFPLLSWKFWWTQYEAYSSLTTHLMLLCRHHAFQRIHCPLPPFYSVFSLDITFVCLLWFEKNHSNERCSSNGVSSSTCCKPLTGIPST